MNEIERTMNYERVQEGNVSPARSATTWWGICGA